MLAMIKKIILAFSLAFYAFAAFAQEEKAISYTSTGKGQPLILIHAFPTGKNLWDPQVAELSKHFQVVTLDLWGFGQSAPTQGQAVSMQDYADEVNQVLDKLHLKKAIIGGESMGGYVALAFAKKYPEKVEGLILSNTQAIADNDAGKEKREKTASDILKNGTQPVVASFILNALSTHASPQTKEFLEKIVAAQSKEGMASALRGMGMREDTSSVLASTSVPVLIITSDNDNVITPEQSKQMHKLAKKSKLVVIKEAGHLSSLEKPNEWNKAVMDWIKE
jgi:pimeloyl-ACP methyl ester carboxylesterase